MVARHWIHSNEPRDLSQPIGSVYRKDPLDVQHTVFNFFFFPFAVSEVMPANKTIANLPEQETSALPLNEETTKPSFPKSDAVKEDSFLEKEQNLFHLEKFGALP